jgi:hypothetical protein
MTYIEKHRRGVRLVRSIVCLAITLLLIVTTSNSQAPPDQEAKPREITSTDFARPKKSSNAPEAPPPKPKIYRLVKSIASPARKRPQGASAQAVQQAITTNSSRVVQQDVGITLWRLRPSKPEDYGPFISVTGTSGKPTTWTPVRVQPNYMFALGDLLRLTIESPHNTFLYVINRESYIDHSLGDAMLIFPTSRTRNGDNRLSAGYLIDIPSWTDQVPYFMLSSSEPRYAGELLTFIFSPEPLDLTIGRKPVAIPIEQLERWEKDWGTEADLYELESGNGQAQTQAEQQATRPTTRRLTQQEPVPQTIYRMRVRSGQPFLINISINASAAIK